MRLRVIEIFLLVGLGVSLWPVEASFWNELVIISIAIALNVVGTMIGKSIGAEQEWQRIRRLATDKWGAAK